MKVLLLHCTADLYGSSRILLNTVKIMRQQEDQVWVVLPEEGPLKNELEQLGARVRILNLGILRRKYFTPWGLFGRIFLWIRAILILSYLLISKKINLVYSNTSGVIVGAMAAAVSRKKHFWHIHEIIEKPRLLAQIIGWLTGSSSKIIVVSEAVKKAWLPFIVSEKLIVIHNGINHAGPPAGGSAIRKELGIADDVLLIGMIGRVIYWKGQLYFLEIAGELHKIFPTAHFVLVGDAFPGYEYIYTEMQNKIAELGIQEKVHDLGYRTDGSNILSGLDLFISPSTMPDPFPTVVLEAMACGIAIAATEHGGVLEMLKNHESGLFIPLQNAKKSAEIIASVLINKEKRMEMGKNAQSLQQNRFSMALFEKDIRRLLAD